MNLLEGRRFFRQIHVLSGYHFTMSVSDIYTGMVNGKDVSFYHNTKSHKIEIVIDYDISNLYVVTFAKGQAIIDFLKAI